jgi:transposase
MVDHRCISRRRTMARVSMAQAGRKTGVVIGVDTHKQFHVARARDGLGRPLAETQIAASQRGYEALLEWARSFGEVDAFGVEGTGSYGAGLARYLRGQGEVVIEVIRPNRQHRRQHGKSDPTDADAAAKALLAGDADAIPKAGDDQVEMVRALRVARSSAIKARGQTRNVMKALIVTAPEELRQALRDLTSVQLVNRCRSLRPGPLLDPQSAMKAALRSLALRHRALEAEIKALDVSLDHLLTRAAPQLLERFGVGTDSAGALLVAAGDNPERLRSEAAFSMLCGSSPVKASSGMTKRHRLNRGGDRQANAALHRIVVVRLRYNQPTKAYLARRVAEGKSKTEILRCLKRYVAREVYGLLQASRPNKEATGPAPPGHVGTAA